MQLFLILLLLLFSKQFERILNKRKRVGTEKVGELLKDGWAESRR